MLWASGGAGKRADLLLSSDDTSAGCGEDRIYSEYGTGLGLEKEVIYAAAVLHDIGKYAQYEDGTPHEQSGEKIASEILDSLPDDAAFFEEEKRMILTAIRGHRKLRADAEPLERLLYTSDKASRMCFACPAEDECDWSAEKKNMELKI